MRVRNSEGLGNPHDLGILEYRNVVKKPPQKNQKTVNEPGSYSGICPGGTYIFSFQGGGSLHPLGHEKPLKSIDFTGPGGA